MTETTAIEASAIKNNITEQIHVLRPTDSQWQEWVDRTEHDFYHTSAYHLYSQRNGEGEAYLAVYGSLECFLALPYLLREIEGSTNDCPLRDVTSVYGYAGPLICGQILEDGFLHRAWSGIHEVWRSQNVVSAFARLHPALNNQTFVETSDSSQDSVSPLNCELVELAPTVSLDLRQTDQEANRDYRSTTRHDIRKARAAGLVTEVDDTWAHLDDFMRIYHITMDRNCAGAYYFFTREQILELKQSLGSHAVLVHVRYAGQIVSSCFFVDYNGFFHAHLEGNDPQFMKFAPFKLMIDDMRILMRGKGSHTLHLGGGRGAQEDSLFRFKAGMSKRRHPFFVAKWLVNPARYEALVEERHRLAARKDLLFEPGDYFPAYRAPLTVPVRSSVEVAA